MFMSNISRNFFNISTSAVVLSCKMFLSIKCHILLIYYLHSFPHVQVCGLPQCSDFNVMLYVVLPAAVALVMVAVILGVCCLRQTHKKPLSDAASSPR